MMILTFPSERTERATASSQHPSRTRRGSDCCGCAARQCCGCRHFVVASTKRTLSTPLLVVVVVVVVLFQQAIGAKYIEISNRGLLRRTGKRKGAPPFPRRFSHGAVAE